MSLLSLIKSKIVGVAAIVVTILLLVSVVKVYSQEAVILKLNGEYQSEHERADRIESENKKLIAELNKKPSELIAVTKSVDKELCSGDIKVSKVINYKPKEVKTNAKDHVDIDARFDDDFIRMLNEN